MRQPLKGCLFIFLNSKIMRLKNKVAIITGSASGIGREIALKFANEGAKVVIADVSSEESKEVVEEILRAGGEAKAIKVDVSKLNEVEELIDKTVANFGSLDIMINNAGIGVSGKELLAHNPETDYDSVININQGGVYYGILVAAKKMVDLGVKGVILNTASVYGTMASDLTFSYNVSKSAVLMMTKCAALELARYGIRVVSVSPGRIDTPMLNTYKMFGFLDHIKKEGMSNRLIQPKEVVNVFAFLASDEASSINGTQIFADDGFSSFKFPLV